MNIDKNEIRRLEKAARDKDKRKLYDWAVQFEGQIRNELDKQYEEAYRKTLLEAVDNFCIAIAYTAHFCEHTKLGKTRLPDFMEDLFITVDMFRTGEYNPEEYKKELERCGVHFNEYKYKHIEDEDRKRRIIESWERK